MNMYMYVSTKDWFLIMYNWSRFQRLYVIQTDIVPCLVDIWEHNAYRRILPLLVIVLSCRGLILLEGFVNPDCYPRGKNLQIRGTVPSGRHRTRVVQLRRAHWWKPISSSASLPRRCWTVYSGNGAACFNMVGWNPPLQNYKTHVQIYMYVQHIRNITYRILSIHAIYFLDGSVF